MKPNFTTNILLGLALFATIMFVMQKFAPTPTAETLVAPAASAVPTMTPASVTPVAPAVPAGQVAQAQPVDSGVTAPAGSASAAAMILPQDNIVIDCPEFMAVFTTQGAALKSYTLRKYFNIPEATKDFARFRLPMAASLTPGSNSLALQEIIVGAGKYELAGYHWQLVALPAGAKPVAGLTPAGSRLVFQITAGEVVLQRIYDFADAQQKQNYFGFAHALVFQNTASVPVALSYRLCGPAGIIPDDEDSGFGTLSGMSGWLTGEKEVSRGDYALSDVSDTGSFFRDEKDTVWLGLHNRFFASILLTRQPKLTSQASFERIIPAKDFAAQFGQDQAWIANVMGKHEYQARAVLATVPFTVQPGTTTDHGFQFYAGPLSDNFAADFNPLLNNIVTYSYQLIGPISRPLLGILQYIAYVTHNYGIAIILLTIMVKVILHPLTRKSMRSQHKMQQVQPLLKQLREKFKDDKQKQQQETMRIFRENGVNPVGGCLPMLLQMPIFFALYGVFSRAFDIRQQDFIPGWINDLSKPDALFSFGGLSLPIIGSTFNLLPVIYILLQMLNMRMMPVSTDPQMEGQMKMMRLMPVFFGFIFYNMPSGLVLYFTVQSLLTIVEHYFLKRTLNAEAALAAVNAGGAGAVAGAVAVEAKVIGSSGGVSGKKKK